MPNLTSKEKLTLVDQTHKHANVFARNPKKPSQTSIVHRMITENASSVKSRYYRVPVAWEKEINSQIQEMLDNDIIRPLSSHWNSLIILLKKGQ